MSRDVTSALRGDSAPARHLSQQDTHRGPVGEVVARRGDDGSGDQEDAQRLVALRRLGAGIGEHDVGNRVDRFRGDGAGVTREVEARLHERVGPCTHHGGRERSQDREQPSGPRPASERDCEGGPARREAGARSTASARMVRRAVALRSPTRSKERHSLRPRPGPARRARDGSRSSRDRRVSRATSPARRRDSRCRPSAGHLRRRRRERPRSRRGSAAGTPPAHPNSSRPVGGLARSNGVPARASGPSASSPTSPHTV